MPSVHWTSVLFSVAVSILLHSWQTARILIQGTILIPLPKLKGQNKQFQTYFSKPSNLNAINMKKGKESKKQVKNPG